MSEWQPIETAPKEKYAHFLVAGGRQWPVVAYRFEGRLFLEYGGGHPVIGATHWMPLPDPPAVEDAPSDPARIREDKQ